MNKTFSRVRRTLISSAIGVLAVVSAGIAAAQDAYPNKPITWVVPFAAGGPTDALARHIADRVARELGQPIVIDNSPGAGGTVGAAKVAKAKNDGYTFLVGHMGYMGAAPALYKKLGYDPVKDFDGVFRFPDTPLVLMVRQNHPAKDIAGLIDFAKKNPEKVFISNAGVGSSSHLIAALVASSAGIKVTMVPYKGAGPALIDVIGGQVDGMLDQTNTALPQIKEGKVRPLVVTSKVRLPQLKDVPTLNETVMPGFEASTWYGIYAPKGTPKAAVEKVQNAYLKVMKDKAYTGKMAEQAIQMLPPEQYTGDALAKHTESEVVRWRAVAARSGLSLD
jgi:tripartite-type tricarboxylate transporter receptor subunit TctC